MRQTLPSWHEFADHTRAKHQALVTLHAEFTPECPNSGWSVAHSHPRPCSKELQTDFSRGEFPIGSVWDARYVDNVNVMVVARNPGGVEPVRASQYREIAKRWVSKAIESDRALFELLNIAIQGFTLNLDEERSYWRSFGPIAKAIAECDGRSYASSEMFRGFYYTNIVKCRSQKGGGGDRSPSANNRRNCLPFLAREIAILKPRKIVCLQLRSANDVLSGHIRACVENARHLNTSIVFNDFEIYDFLHLSARGEGMTNAAKKEKTEAAGQMLRRGKFKCRFSNGAWFDGNDYFRAF